VNSPAVYRACEEERGTCAARWWMTIACAPPAVQFRRMPRVPRLAAGDVVVGMLHAWGGSRT